MLRRRQSSEHAQERSKRKCNLMTATTGARVLCSDCFSETEMYALPLRPVVKTRIMEPHIESNLEQTVTLYTDEYPVSYSELSSLDWRMRSSTISNRT